jgi:uroporphyrin-III C-methyltransferase/precorrin-2 dehydrogenase/sirohydrochlorin ferrochelatase
MAVNHVGAVAEALIRFGQPPSTPVTVIADGTMPTQRVMQATLETVGQRVASEGIQPPAVVVIGGVVAVAAELAQLARDLRPASIAGPPAGDGANQYELTQAGRWKEGA